MSIDALFGGGDSGAEEPSKAELELKQTAARDWNDYVKLYTPVEDELVKRLADYKSTRSDKLGEVASTAAEALDAGGKRMSKLKAGGMPGNVGAVLRQTLDDATTYRKGLAGAAPKIEEGLAGRDIKGNLKVVSTERGLQDSASTSLGQQAKRATEEAINDAQARSQTNAAMWNAITGAAGAAAAPYIRKRQLSLLDGTEEPVGIMDGLKKL